MSIYLFNNVVYFIMLYTFISERLITETCCHGIEFFMNYFYEQENSITSAESI